MENKKAGRPKINEELKKQLVTIRLLPANIEFYKNNGKANLINELLNKVRESCKFK